MWRYYFLRACVMLVSRLPSPLAHLIALLVGDCAYLLARRSRATYIENLRHVLGPRTTPAALRRCCRKAFHNLFLNYYDLVRIPRVRPQQLARMVELHGFERLEAAPTRGATVLASAHLGNLDLVTQISLYRDYGMTILVEQLRPQRVHDLVMRLRKHQGMSFEPAERSGIKAAFRALHRGEVVALACDRPVHGVGVMLDFFGSPALLPTGAADLALRTGANVVCAVNVRVGRNRYQAFAESIPVTHAGHSAEAVRALSAQILRVIERYVRQYPDQWMAFHPIWRSAPEPVAAAREVSLSSESKV